MSKLLAFLLGFVLVAVTSPGCACDPPPDAEQPAEQAGPVQEMCVALHQERFQLDEPTARYVCRAGSRVVVCLAEAVKKDQAAIEAAFKAEDWPALLKLVPPGCFVGLGKPAASG